jgi:hypothetical protein
MNFLELPEFKELYNQLVKFSQDSNMSSYYAFKNTKQLIKAIIQKWLDESGIEASIRLERVCFLRPHGIHHWHSPHYAFTVNQIQLFNGKGSLDKKSRWLNKITIRFIRSDTIKAKIVNAVARTDADFLEPTPTNFKNFINDLFNALAIQKE